MKGWIDLETAADRFALSSRQRPFRSFSKRDMQKLLRALRDLLVAGCVDMKIEGDRKRYRQLTSADALSLPFGIHFELDDSVGAETIFNPDELRPMLLREADFELLLNPVDKAPSIRFLTREDLKTRGISYSNAHLIEMERKGLFPKRRTLSSNRIAWVENEIDAWMKVRLDRDVPSARRLR